MWSKCGFDVVNWIHATTIIGVHLSAIKIHHIGTVPLQFYSTSKYTTTYTFDVFLDQNSLIFHIPPTARFFPSSLSPSENDITNAAQPPAWPHASTARHAARVRCSVTRPAWTHAGSSCRMNARHMPSSAAGLSQLGWVGQSWRLWRSG